MDDSSYHQFQNLKNLNSMLLKETSQRRQQIQDMDVRFSEAEEKNDALDLEKDLLFVFMETHMREIGFGFDKLVGEKNDLERVLSERESDVLVLKGEVTELSLRLENETVEIVRVSEERERVKNELDGVVAEFNVLREKVLESEKVREEMEKLRVERERLLDEGFERERVIGELKKDFNLAIKSSEESREVIEKLKEEIEAVTRERDEVVKVKNDQELRIVGLGFELKQLNESLKNLRKEEASMRARIAALEGSLGLAAEKEKEMEVEISGLLREKKEMEMNIEMLIERGESIKNVLSMAQKGLEDKQHELDDAIRARDEIANLKDMRENEIAEVKSEVIRLRDIEHKLEGSCRDLEEKNKQLVSEVNHLRNSIDEVTVEKDNIKKGFDEEKNKVENLSLQVVEMKGKVEQTEAELDQVNSEQEKLIERSKMLESHVSVLKNEKDTLHMSHQETQQQHDDLRAKFEYSCNNSNQALAMLKNTAAFVCQDKDSVGVDEVISNGKKLEEEIQPYVEELDAIRNAFKTKNEIIDGMKQQIESLQKSVAEAHKNKTLLPVISSATTIFAAALAAYVTRRR
ncbi:hypothetical protein Lal_00047263 [Lupinus albus]|uniref:Putative transcription factor bZIP family n=1 Tax=Lupinus albus TaxID=3870 RepID=A0A6A4QYV0_LUPAL|nr:putative transcription factor bZIP family [Lupinus albus]KAF1878594.1 hypothetical protein Lal_00047263 [Lupinus albus]